MKKFFLAFVFLVGLFFVGPTNVSAHEDSDNTLRHAYRPYTVTENNWMRARVNNHTMVAQKRLVCVEAFNNVSGAKTHLGCLWVELDPMGGEMWAREFEAPTNLLKPGSYKVVYTYQDDHGQWNHIKGINMQVWDGVYTTH